jgi:hypothetical protein
VLKQLQNVFKRLFPNSQPSTQGSQRSLSLGLDGSIRRRYDLEILENPIREPAKARDLIEMMQWCYEARHCLSIACGDAFASSDGDDQGWTVADTLDDNETKIHPDTYAIAIDLINRRESHEDSVIGGDKLQKALRWALGYGDCFLELGIEKEGVGRNDYGISKTLYLPTWELFRKENDQGYLEGFEQRRHLSSKDPEYFFYPPQICHFRYEESFLYGTSIFDQSRESWEKLKEATENLANAARDVGINPNLHVMPPGATAASKEEYRQKHEQLKLQGTITDFYLYSEQEIKKLSGVNPNLQPLIDNLLEWRYRIIPPGFPVYFFPGLVTTGAREISAEPAKRYSRMRNSWCALLTKGIKQAIDTEIVLKKGWDWFIENGRYRIIWAKWTVGSTGMESEDDESDTEGIEDLD